MGGRSNSQVIGYRYLLGIHMGISRGPVDELIEIKVGDRPVWRGSVTGNTTFNIDAGEVFGGEDGEGGIVGPLTTMFGGPSQTAPAALGSVLQTPMPGFRRMFTVFFDGVIAMINPYPKPWKFRVRRVTEGWDGGCWFPERARVTLVREVSAAEQQSAASGAGNTSTSTEYLNYPTDLQQYGVFFANDGAGDSQNQFWAQNGPINFPVPLPPGGVLQAVEAISFTSGTGIDAVVVPIDNSFWSVQGNTITLLPKETVTGASGNVFDLAFAPQININVRVTVTSVIPGSPGTPGGGPGGMGVTTIHAMNPVHILYETLTNREWGRGLPREALDDANWRAAAERAHSENFGLCIRWNRQDDIQSFIKLILDHLNATIYEDRTTGKIKIFLIRGDYDRAQVQLFTPDTGLIEVNDCPVAAQGPLINELRVKYVDPVTDTERTVRASNLANLQASGGEINSMTKDYLGIPVAELAARVCKRDLKAASTKLRKFTVTLDRRGFNVIPGGVIRIEDRTRNITDIVLRVGSVDYGHMRDGRIKVTAVQDVFALPSRAFSVMPPPQYTPPNSRPCLGPAAAFEMPYWAIAKTMTAGDFATVDNTDAYVGTVVGEGQPMNLSYNVAIKSGGALADEQPADDAFYCGYTP